MTTVTVHKRILENGSHSFSLEIYQAGKRRYEKIGGVGLHANPNNKLSYTRALRLAEDARAKRQVELASLAAGLNAAHYIPRSDDLITYMQRLATTYSGNTHRTWLDAISALRRHAHAVPLQSITRDYLETLQRTMLASGLQPGTVRTYLSRVSIALNRAVRDSLIPSNPMHTIKLVKPLLAERKYLELADLKRLAALRCDGRTNGSPGHSTDTLSVPVTETRDAFLFACFCGLRLSDVKALKWNRLSKDDTGQWRIEFRQQKTKGSEHFPFSEQAHQMLERLAAERGTSPDEKIFRLVCDANINRHLQLIGRKAELRQGLHFHISRHTFAYLLLLHDVDIYTISKLLGHTSIKTTEIYLRMFDKKKYEAVGKLPVL